MNILDLVLSIILLLGLVRGLFKGFFVELAGILSLLGGIYAAIHFSDHTYRILDSLLDWDEKYLSILAFALNFLLVAFLISLAARFLTKMINILALGLVNRLLGGIFGILKMAFLASLFFMFFEDFGIFDAEEDYKEASVLYPPVRVIAPALLPTIIKEVKEEDLFDSSPETVIAPES
jgi:membrane protein required for colicin V production